MSKSDTFESDLVKLIFNATAIANIADNAASAPLTNLYLALHTADPGEAGNQTTSEATYGGYARTAIPRTSGGFTVTNNTVTNAAIVSAPQCTSGSNTINYFSIGTLVSGTGKILYSGPITSPAGGLAVSTSIQPQFAIGTLSSSED